MEIIKCEHLEKNFGTNKVITDLNMSVNEQEFVAIMGPSGCGKTTLLNIIGLLDNHTNGHLSLFGEKDVSMNSRKALCLLRNKISFVFQNYGLIDDETVFQNLCYALAYKKVTNKRKEIEDVLKKLEMDNFIDQKVYSLSGGQQQRIALARVLLKPGELILADEPTGNLDEENSKRVFEVLNELNQQGKTIVIVTHDSELAKKCSRVIEMG